MLTKSVEQTENYTGRSKFAQRILFTLSRKQIHTKTQENSSEFLCNGFFVPVFFLHAFILFFFFASTLFVYLHVSVYSYPFVRVNSCCKIDYYIANFLLAFWYHFWSMHAVARCADAATVAFALLYRRDRLRNQLGSHVVM